MLRFAASTLLAVGAATAQSNEPCLIVRVAGGGLAAAGDGGPALEAELRNPRFIRRGPDGLVYFADVDHRRIRRISEDERIETIVGDGRDLTSGNGGPGTQASVSAVRGMEFGPDGSLYWMEADFSTTWIRRLTPQGVVEAVAGARGRGGLGDGGPAIEAGIDYATAFDVAPDGSIYVAIPNRSRRAGVVRRIDPAGVIDTVLGGPPRPLDDPRNFTGLAVDAFTRQPDQILVESDGSYLLRDQSPTPLRRITPDGKIAPVLARVARFGPPPEEPTVFPLRVDLRLDDDDRLYWRTGPRIERLTDDLRNEVVWEASDQSIVWSFTVEGDGELFGVLDRQVEQLRQDGERVALAGLPRGRLAGGDGGPATEAVLSPRHIAVAPDGAVLVYDSYTHRIRRVQDGVITNFAGNGLFEDPIEDMPATESSLGPIGSIVASPEGDVYVVGRRAIRRIGRDGRYARYAGREGFECQRRHSDCGDGGPAVDAVLGEGLHAAWDGEGGLYVVHRQFDAGNERGLALRRIGPDGVIETLDVENPRWTLRKLVVDSDGRPVLIGEGRWVWQWEEGSLNLISPQHPYILNSWTAGPDSTFYTASSWNSLLQVLPDGSERTIIPEQVRDVLARGDGGPAAEALLGGVRGMALSPQGDLIIADSGARTVRRINQIGECAADDSTMRISILLSAAARGGAAAAGSLFSVFGSDLGPDEPVVAQPDTEGRYPRELGGTVLTIGGRPAPLLFVSGSQINGVMPSAAELDQEAWPVTDVSTRTRAWTVLTRVERGGRSSLPRGTWIPNVSPALFSLGDGQAAALNQDGSINSRFNPAAPGSVIVFFGTGIGAMTPSPESGAIVSADPLPRVVEPIAVSVGGEEAQVLYAGSAPGLVSGVFQLNVLIPAEQQALGAQRIDLEIGETFYRTSLHVILGR